MPNLRQFFLAAILLMLSILIFIYLKQKQTQTCIDCNVILISLDSLGADHVGVYGYDRNTTPNIDSFARDGILFKNYLAQSYLTPVSEASLFMSVYPRVHGLTFAYLRGLGSSSVLDNSLTIAQILKYYNYSTVGFSSSPEISGYQYTPLSRGFDLFIDIPDRQLPNMSQVFSWLDNNKDKKFFLYLAIGTIHQPFADKVPSSLVTEYDPSNYSGTFLNQNLNYSIFARIYNNTYYNVSCISCLESENPSAQGDPRPFANNFVLSKEDEQYVIARYDVGINYVDQYLGQFIQKLKESGRDKNTIIIITSEHGEGLGEHKYFWHYDIYDTEVHAPLIIKNPALQDAGKTIETQAQSIDILPTILDFLGITKPVLAEGNSLVPAIEGTAPADFNKYIFIEGPLWEQRHLLNPIYSVAVRTNEWKLIYREDSELLKNISLWGRVSNQSIPISKFELYNLKNDPTEQKNIINDQPLVANQLKQKLFDWLNYVNGIREKEMIQETNSTTQIIFPYP